jgi:hypothetical protein
MTYIEHLYTIVLDYKGGTYVSQAPGPTPAVALEQWAYRIPETDLQQWKLERDALSTVIDQGGLVLLTGLANVWCQTGSDQTGQLILLTIIATEPVRIV